jgi:outer membrane protein OmpA-like peptidoglycan-associated protein
MRSLGFQVFFNDFQTASELREHGLSYVINNNDWYKASRMFPGIGLTYQKGMTERIDFASALGASYVRYPIAGNFNNNDYTSYLLLDVVGAANFKLLPDRYTVNPFVTAGVGASKYKGHFAAFMPVGLGVQVKLLPEIYLQLASQYRIRVTENAAYHLNHSIGIVAPLKQRVTPPPVELPPVVLDRDNDGVVDSLDRCPDVPGLAALAGCPDRDGDGIADDDDKCPDVAGLAKYGGCPIPDTDGDGINDEEDKCPTEKGYARYQGCPIPDTDGDGVNDEEDKCPNRPGPAENMGCPVISKEVIEKVNFAAKNVFFNTGSAKLLPKSYKSLDEVAKLMLEDESLKMDIDGHTDSQGSDELNQTLSEKRANAVRDYLISKGIDPSRLKATGYGESRPIADNNTAAGRAKNRRTEMTVRNY